jgi:hypothetical protein
MMQTLEMTAEDGDRQAKYSSAYIAQWAVVPECQLGEKEGSHSDPAPVRNFEELEGWEAVS